MVSVSYQAADLKRKRKKLGGEEDEVDRQIEVGGISEKRDCSRHTRPSVEPSVSPPNVYVQTLPRLIQERDQLKEELERMREEKHQARELIQRAREERGEAKEEEERLREERDRARDESRRAKVDKERLESKVALLQERCDRLSRRIRCGFQHRTSTHTVFLLHFYYLLYSFSQWNY